MCSPPGRSGPQNGNVSVEYSTLYRILFNVQGLQNLARQRASASELAGIIEQALGVITRSPLRGSALCMQSFLKYRRHWKGCSKYSVGSSKSPRNCRKSILMDFREISLGTLHVWRD